jgi:hypothetical protein
MNNNAAKASVFAGVGPNPDLTSAAARAPDENVKGKEKERCIHYPSIRRAHLSPSHTTSYAREIFKPYPSLTNAPMYKICIHASMNKNVILRLRWAGLTVAVVAPEEAAMAIEGSGRTSERRERSC